ncbi:Protein kinase domain-containing protein [Nonomuraea solani]|uniref:Protein kinase domain-containing protein n=1 Tax=Nonomuraea solani TaxID=1144553 RepID=A0A1H5Y0Q2_9ACTN|nr:WD40 repeat domain-containing serine/threonine-protein kinase [Nonomuraea solani]SEG17518.1 Protein kinase domain-containing protein [Nonomuraea solani]
MATALLDGDPQRLGPYWLAGRLGAGGQGVVYEAYTEDARRVAIKVLHGDQAAQLGREATAARRVASFCTAGVLDARLEGPRPYIVSEYVEGPSLRQVVAGGRRFADGDLHRLATAIATALTAVHEAGVIHRDLKPDNVLLGPDGPRVIDFGISRTMEMSLTETGLVTGTPTYMAPEVFTGQRAGAPADVFAWGGIVMFAATGADPFQAESLGGVMHRVLSASPDLSVLPESLRSLVAAALAKDPLDRPAARELLLALVSGGGRMDIARLLAEGGREAGQIAVRGDDPALGTLAEQAYAMLGPAERELVAEVFLRLVTVDEGGDLTVRRAAQAELLQGRALHEVTAIERILEVFAYLLSRSGEEIWLARPALTHAWPRFRRWIDTNRDGLAVHREILTAARRWDGAGRRDGDLFRGSSLENALTWAANARRNITLAPVERNFLEASADRDRRGARRARLVSLSLGGLLVISVVAGGLAVQQGAVADRRAEEITVALGRSEATRLAALAPQVRVTDPMLAMRLSAAAWSLDHTPRTRAGLVAALAQRERAVFTDPAGAGDTVRALGADGRTLTSVGQDAAQVWDVRTGKRIGGIPRLGMAGDQVTGVALSPSGRTLVVLTDKRLRAWEPSSGKVIRTWTFDRPLDLVNGWADLTRVDDLAVAIREPDLHRRWDLRTGERSRLAVADTVASADGTWLATPRSRTVRLTGQTDKAVVDIGVKDGAGTQGTWNRGAVTVSGDGKLLASVAGENVQFWRMPDPQLLTTVPLLGNLDAGGEQPQGAFDGRTFRYLVEDRVFSIDVADLAAAPPRSTINFGTLSPDGRLLAAQTGDRTELRDARGGRPLPAMENAFFSADGRLLAGTGQGKVTIVDVASRAALGEVVPVAGDLEPDVVRFSPDGSRVALVLRDSDDGRAVQVWDWKAGRKLFGAALKGTNDVAFSPDGRTLAVAGAGQLLLDAATGKPVTGPFSASGSDTTGIRIFFLHQSRGLVVLDSRGRLTLWDTAGKPLGPVARGDFGSLPIAAHSPREDVIAVGAENGRVQVFDAATGTSLGTLLDTGGGQDPDAGQLQSIAFTADGAGVVTVDLNGTVRTHAVGPAGVIRAICGRAGGSLTAAEWKTYVPSLPYRRSCP